MSHIENMEKILECIAEKTKVKLDEGVDAIDTHELYEIADIMKDMQESIYKATIVKSMQDAEKEDEMMDKLGVDPEDRRYYNDYRYRTTGRYAPTGRGTRESGRRGYSEPMDMYLDPEQYRDVYYSGDSVRRRMPRMYYDGGRMYYDGAGMSGGSSSGSTGGNMSNTGMNSSNGRMYYDGSNMTGAADRNQRQESRYDRARRNYTENKEMHKTNSTEDKQSNMQSLESYMSELSSDLTELMQNMTPEERSLAKNKMTVLASKM